MFQKINSFLKRYNDKLDIIEKAGNKKHFAIGIAMALIFFIIFTAMGVAFWYGTVLSVHGEISSGTTFSVFWVNLKIGNI